MVKILLIIINCLVQDDDSDDECPDLNLDEEEQVDEDEAGDEVEDEDSDDLEDEEIEENNHFVDYDSEENEVTLQKKLLKWNFKT